MIDENRLDLKSIKKFTKEQIENLTAFDIKKILPQNISLLSENQFNCLSKEQIEAFTVEQIQAISLNQIDRFSWSIIRYFGKNIKYLSLKQINMIPDYHLTNEQREILKEKIEPLGTDIVDILKKNTLEIDDCSHICRYIIHRLSPLQMSNMSPEHIALLTKELRINSFTEEQIQALNEDQIKAIAFEDDFDDTCEPEVIQYLGEKIVHLTDKQLNFCRLDFCTEEQKKLLREKIGLIDDNVINNLVKDNKFYLEIDINTTILLSPLQISKILPQNIILLSGYYFNYLSEKQIQAFSKEQIQCMTSAQVEKFYTYTINFFGENIKYFTEEQKKMIGKFHNHKYLGEKIVYFN